MRHIERLSRTLTHTPQDDQVNRLVTQGRSVASCRCRIARDSSPNLGLRRLEEAVDLPEVDDIDPVEAGREHDAQLRPGSQRPGPTVRNRPGVRVDQDYGDELQDLLRARNTIMIGGSSVASSR